MFKGETLKNIVKEYSNRIRAKEKDGNLNLETELLYFLYDCEMDIKKLMIQEKSDTLKYMKYVKKCF